MNADEIEDSARKTAVDQTSGIYTAVIADTDSAALSHLRSYLSELGVQVVAEARDGERCLVLVDEEQPDFLFVAEDLAVLDGLEVATNLATRRTRTLVTLIATQGRFAFLRRAMQAGVREILLRPVQRNEVEEALANLTQILEVQRHRLRPSTDTSSSRPSPGAIQVQEMTIAVFSSKGGVGKSLIAVNLAIWLHQLTQKQVALVDLDFQAGNVGVLLDVPPDNRTLRLVETDEITASLLQESLIQHKTGVAVLPTPQEAQYAELFTQPVAQAILMRAQQDFDYLVIDTPSSLTEPSLTALDIADRIVYVTVPNVPTIKNTRQGLDVMQALHYPASKIFLIANTLEPVEDIRIEEVQTCLQEPIRSVLPYDPHTVIDAINSGVSLVEGYPHARVTQALEQIAHMLIGHPIPEETKQPRGWLARLKSL